MAEIIADGFEGQALLKQSLGTRIAKRMRPRFLDANPLGQRGIRRFMRQILLAGEEPDERPALLRDLIAETAARFPDRVTFQIGPEQGTFMTMLASLMGARQVVEVGTFTGYSSLCLARGLADGGKLLCCDVSEEWTSVARRYWPRARVSNSASRPCLSVKAPMAASTRAFSASVHCRIMSSSCSVS